MKLNKNIIYLTIIVFILGSIFGLFIYNKFNKDSFTLPEGKVIVSQKFLDSLTYIANLPPVIVKKDSIVRDTIWLEKATDPTSNIDPVDSTITVINSNLYIKDTIDTKINFKIKGELIGKIKWSFNPIYHYKIITIDRPKPYPIIEKVYKDKYRNGYYLSGNLGGNNRMFLLGADIDIVTKNDYIYGIRYQKFGDNNIYSVKVGINLNNLFKRKNR